MRAIAACLLLALVLLPHAQARDVRHATPGDCPEKTAKAPARAKATVAPMPAPVREARTRDADDDDTPGRLNVSPRWHSFLPGMIR